MSVEDARERDTQTQARGNGMTVAERDRHNLLEHIDDLERELKILRRNDAARRRRVLFGISHAVGR